MWTDEDRAWALALLTYEAELCSGCGQSREQSTAADNEFSYVAEPLRCHACAAVARASEPFQAPGADARGLLMSVTTRDRRGRG